jgi:two-component system, LytTR family, response regulator
MTAGIKAFIADDEPPARNKIRKFLQGRTDVTVAGEAGDGVSTIQQVLELRPDLLFLDIQMPNGDGFDVLREVYPEHKPSVIFTTAYDQYAIRAFEVEALDYLLKPFTADRFHAALDRALRARSQPAAEPRASESKVANLLAQLAANQPRNPRILVRNNDRLFFVKANEVEWVEAEEKYVLLHTKSQRHMVRHSISALEQQLGPAGFVRIHRSHLVNLESLQELVSLGRGDCVAVLKSGTQLPVGRNFKERLLAAMGQSGMAR